MAAPPRPPGADRRRAHALQGEPGLRELSSRRATRSGSRLLLTTNATVVDERILALLPAFGAVAVTSSIDDVGPRFGTRRAPGRWDDTEPIVRRYAMTTDRPHGHQLLGEPVQPLVPA